MADRKPRLTAQTLQVLDALLTWPGSAGADISRHTKLPSGTLYPILLRLEDAGWLSSEWEGGNPPELGRPRRRFYRVTAEGALAARSAAEELRPLIWRLA